MKTIGLIGGTSWVSTVEYYRYFNELTNARLGGVASSQCIVYSIDYGRASAARDSGDMETMLGILSEGVCALEAGGANCVLLGANTMHMFADTIQQKTKLPLIHIGDVTAKAIQQKGLKKVALLGTKFTMEGTFISSRMQAHGIEVLVPDETDRAFIHTTIHSELAKNNFRPETRDRYLEIIDKLVAQGAAGTILGCTEIPLLIKPEHTSLPVFDTTFLHAEAAVNFALD